MSATVDEEGVQAPGYRFAIPDHEPESFAARWIYVNQDEWPGRHDLALFRKTVELPDQPQQVTARISADVCFRLYVNGIMVARGPDDIGSDIPVIVKDRYAISTRQWLYVVRDLTPYFQPGANTIAAEVFVYQRAGAYLTAGKPGFWLDAQVTRADGDSLSIATDASWQSSPGEYLVCAAPGACRDDHAPAPDSAYNERAARADMTCVAAQEPVGWLEGRDGGATWKDATEIESIWGPMAPSEIPPCMEARYPVREIVDVEGAIDVPVTPEEGQTIRIKGDGSFYLKVDRVIPAYVGVRVNGCAGAELLFSWEELRGNPNRVVACILRDGKQSFEFPGYGSCTYLRVEARNVTRPIEIRDIQLVFTSQPVEYRGSFECSDPELNALWKSSRHALQICMQTHHLDSPHHQEPISDPGDYLIEALINFQVFGAPWLVRQDLRKFARVLTTVEYRNFHTSYSLLWLQMLMAYYDYTGDQGVVLETAEQVHKLLDTFESWRGKNGLICNAPTYMFLDWVDIAGFSGHHPPAVIGMGYMSAFYYRGLVDGIRVAELQGDSSRLARYRELRAELCTDFNAVLWDEDEGLYRDGVPFVSEVAPFEPWLPPDQDVRTHTPHVNSLAVLYDLAPENRQADIMHRAMRQSSVEVQPYFMHFVFDALDHAGVFGAYAVDLLKRWTIVEETQTSYEMWGKGDLSHAWNGTVLYQMSTRILGIAPLDPGFSRVAVCPQPCGLTFARGLVPTPHGDITVDWSLKGEELEIQVNTPDACDCWWRAQIPGPARVDG